MTLHFIDNPGKPVPEPQLSGIDAWLKSHVPANNRIMGSSPPLGSKPAPAPANAAQPKDVSAAGSTR